MRATDCLLLLGRNSLAQVEELDLLDGTRGSDRAVSSDACPGWP